MADFNQSAASRQAIHDAARDFLDARILSGKSAERAKEFGVSQRTIERWRSSLEGKGSQKRSPLHRLSTFGKQKIQMKLDATLVVGGNPKYARFRRGIVVHVDRQLLNHALGDEESQDEAWQDFFDDYLMPEGEVENIQHLSFH